MQGFVSNKDMEAGDARGDPLEAVLYAVFVAIDWFLDGFRTAVNVSGDLFACMIIYKMTKIEDPPEVVEQIVERAGLAGRSS